MHPCRGAKTHTYIYARTNAHSHAMGSLFFLTEKPIATRLGFVCLLRRFTTHMGHMVSGSYMKNASPQKNKETIQQHRVLIAHNSTHQRHECLAERWTAH